MITFKVVIVCVGVLLLPQLAIEAMPPAKRPAGRLKSKPAAAVRATHVKPRAGGKSSGVARLCSAAQSRAMKLLMKALGSQRASGSGKVGKAGKAKCDLIAEPPVLRGAEEDDEDEDDFTPDRTVDPGPPPQSSKPLFFDALARGAAKHYSRMSSKVQPGTALHSIHYQRVGSVDVEASTTYMRQKCRRRVSWWKPPFSGHLERPTLTCRTFGKAQTIYSTSAAQGAVAAACAREKELFTSCSGRRSIEPR